MKNLQDMTDDEIEKMVDSGVSTATVAPVKAPESSVNIAGMDDAAINALVDDGQNKLIQKLVDDESFDPSEAYTSGKADLDTAIAVYEKRGEKFGWGDAAKFIAKEVATAPVALGKGVYDAATADVKDGSGFWNQVDKRGAALSKRMEGNTLTGIVNDIAGGAGALTNNVYELAKDPTIETNAGKQAAVENLAAIQTAGVDTGIMAKKAGRILSKINDSINPFAEEETEDEKRDYYRGLFSMQKEQKLASTGATAAPVFNETLESLKEGGAIVSPEAIQKINSTSNWQNIVPGMTPGRLVRNVAGRGLMAAGATAESIGTAIPRAAKAVGRYAAAHPILAGAGGAGSAAGMAYTLYQHPGETAAGIGLLAAGSGLGKLGGFVKSAGKELYDPYFMTQGAQKALAAADKTGSLSGRLKDAISPRQNLEIGKAAVRAGIGQSVAGGIDNAAVAALTTDSPEEFAREAAAGIGLGMISGMEVKARQGARGMNVETLGKQLANEGRDLNFQTGWDAAHKEGIESISKEEQFAVNKLRGALGRLRSEDGSPIQIYIVNGKAYGTALGDNAEAGADSHAFTSEDGTKIFVNADATSSTGKKLSASNVTGHEAVHSIEQAVASQVSPKLMESLISDMRSKLYKEDGTATPEFQQFILNYNKALGTDVLTPQDYQNAESEFLAETGRAILSGGNIEQFGLPKALRTSIMEATGDMLRDTLGIQPKSRKLGFGASEIASVTRNLNNVLFDLGKKLHDEAQTGAKFRLEQLKEATKNPPPENATPEQLAEYDALVRKRIETENLIRRYQAKKAAKTSETKTEDAKPEAEPPPVPESPESAPLHGITKEARDAFIEQYVDQLQPMGRKPRKTARELLDLEGEAEALIDTYLEALEAEGRGDRPITLFGNILKYATTGQIPNSALYINPEAGPDLSGATPESTPAADLSTADTSTDDGTAGAGLATPAPAPERITPAINIDQDADGNMTGVTVELPADVTKDEIRALGVEVVRNNDLPPEINREIMAQLNEAFRNIKDEAAPVDEAPSSDATPSETPTIGGRQIVTENGVTKIVANPPVFYDKAKESSNVSDVSIKGTPEAPGGYDAIEGLLGGVGAILHPGIARRQQLEREGKKRSDQTTMGAEWDAFLDIPPRLRRLIFSDTGISPDEAAQTAFEQGIISEPTPDALAKALRDAWDTRLSYRENAKEANAEAKVTTTQGKRFENEVKKPSVGGGRPIKGENLNVGDVLDVKEGQITVVDYDPFDGTVTLEGDRYGRQIINTDDVIYGEIAPTNLSGAIAGDDANQTVIDLSGVTGEPTTPKAESATPTAVQHGEFPLPGYTAIEPKSTDGESAPPPLPTEPPPIPKSEAPKTTSESAPLTVQQVNDAAGYALKDYVPSKRKKPKTIEEEVKALQREEIMRRHAKRLPDDTHILTRRFDPETGESEISGRRIIAADPAHVRLMDEAGLTPSQQSQVVYLMDNADGRQPMRIIYDSAARVRDDQTAEQRKESQRVSTAEQRARGEAESELANKVIVPVKAKVTKAGRMMIFGFSPDKLIGNVLKGIEIMGENSPYSDVNDPNLAADWQSYVDNQRNGYTGQGDRALMATDGVPVNVNPNYTPRDIGKEKADFFNLIQGNEQAKGNGQRAYEFRTFAEINQNVPDANLETNPLRGELNQSGTIRFGEDAGSQRVFEPVWESIRADLIHEVEPAFEQGVDIRDQDRYEGSRSDFTAAGLPRGDFTAAGFMPIDNSEGGSKAEGSGLSGVRFSPQTETEEFKRWFGDSKVVDDDGNPLVVYHGTPDAEFDSFKGESHFTENPEYASIYTNTNASSINSRPKKGDAPAVYPVYLSIQNPLDTRIKKHKDIFNNEFFMKWGNGTPLSERGLPDWTDGRDLIEWIEETGQPFDGVILDEGGTPEYGHRGQSWVALKPSQIKSATGNSGAFDPMNPDIRYSPVINEIAYRGDVGKPKSANEEPAGIHWSESESYARQYTEDSNKELDGVLREMYINIDRPLDFTNLPENPTREDVSELLREAGVKESDELPKWTQNGDIKTVKDWLDNVEFGEDFSASQITDATGELIKKAGVYDGLIFREGLHSGKGEKSFVVFSDDQISETPKSTPIDFSNILPPVDKQGVDLSEIKP